ncbi:putative flippase GtrA [Cupriavidus alkaliphilus]|nr:putative flippase GtrA [Cupriavidus alkaliphilus]
MAGLIYIIQFNPGNASATGYLISTLYNYYANARYTFGGGHNHARSFPRFLVTAAVGLGINQVVLLGLISLSMPVIIAQFVATATVLLWNYFINAIWAFSRRDSL